MARSVRARIETRSARLRLPARKEPYWQTLEPGVSAGYYRPANGGAGMWWGRVRVAGRYAIEALAAADDHADAAGASVLNWPQAQARVRAWAGRQTQSGPSSVASAVASYLDDLRARKGERAAHEARLSLERHLIPVLGGVGWSTLGTRCSGRGEIGSSPIAMTPSRYAARATLQTGC